MTAGGALGYCRGKCHSQLSSLVTLTHSECDLESRIIIFYLRQVFKAYFFFFKVIIFCLCFLMPGVTMIDLKLLSLYGCKVGNRGLV